MFRDILFLISLLLALYGLSGILSSVVLWFSLRKNPKGELLLIPVSQEPLIKKKIGAILEQLRNSGMVSVVTVMVVDCGIPVHKLETVTKFCEKKDIVFCKREELVNYLENPSFQKKENTV